MVMYSCDQFLAGTDPVFGITDVSHAWMDTVSKLEIRHTSHCIGLTVCPFSRLYMKIMQYCFFQMLGDFRFMGVAIGKNDKCMNICRRGGKFTAVVAYIQ